MYKIPNPDDGWRPSVGTMIHGDGGFIVLTTGGWMYVTEMLVKANAPYPYGEIDLPLMVATAKDDRWGRALRLSDRQWSLLEQIRRATDGETPLQRSGEVTTRGLCARGSTVTSLETRGLVTHEGFCAEVDGDGFTVRENVAFYACSPAGREALRLRGEER